MSSIAACQSSRTPSRLGHSLAQPFAQCAVRSVLGGGRSAGPRPAGTPRRWGRAARPWTGQAA
eukprot:3360733-Prymnesium_polylepis.1